MAILLALFAYQAYIPGEQGKVDESMREMAAIEALKSEKADKEVCLASLFPGYSIVLTKI
jgi:hypothetical protein